MNKSFMLYIRSKQYPRFGNRNDRNVRLLSGIHSNLLCKNDQYLAGGNTGITELIRNDDDGNNIRLYLH